MVMLVQVSLAKYTKESLRRKKEASSTSSCFFSFCPSSQVGERRQIHNWVDWRYCYVRRESSPDILFKVNILKKFIYALLQRAMGFSASLCPCWQSLLSLNLSKLEDFFSYLVSETVCASSLIALLGSRMLNHCPIETCQKEKQTWHQCSTKSLENDFGICENTNEVVLWLRVLCIGGT